MYVTAKRLKTLVNQKSDKNIILNFFVRSLQKKLLMKRYFYIAETSSGGK